MDAEWKWMSVSSRACVCGRIIPFTCVIDGKQRNLKNRKFCLTCSPFGMHNTRNINVSRSNPAEKFRKYQERERRERKARLVELLGGKCSVCGYRKCIDALEFHHQDPEKKEFPLSKVNLLKRWPVVLLEAEKLGISSEDIIQMSKRL